MICVALKHVHNKIHFVGSSSFYSVIKTPLTNKTVKQDQK